MAFNPDHFATQLRVKRAERKWSQEDLAAESGVSRNNIARYEMGENTPGIDAACKIADAFGCSLDDFNGPPEEPAA